MKIKGHRKVDQESEGSLRKKSRKKSWEKNKGEYTWLGYWSLVSRMMRLHRIFFAILMGVLQKDGSRLCLRDCVQNHSTCSWPLSIFFGSLRLHGWQGQSKAVKSDIFQTKRCCVSQAIGQINLCPPLEICSGALPHCDSLFGVTTLQTVELTMPTSIKRMHFPHFPHHYEYSSSCL